MGELKIEVFKADRGDCLLVSCTGGKKTNIVIDLGVTETYTECIEPKLIELKAKSEDIDLLVLTHVDDDHIGGAESFLKQNGRSDSPSYVSVKDIWFNSYRHLMHHPVDGEINEDVRHLMVRQMHSTADAAETKISAEDGTTIAGLIYKNAYPWNYAFDGNAVKAEKKPVYINEEVKITVLTPINEQLSSLQKKWFREIKKIFPEVIFNDDEILDDAVLFATRYLEDDSNSDADAGEHVSKGNLELLEGKFTEDPSPINSSSITFILEFEDKKLLFLADSPPTEVLNQLKNVYPEMSHSKPVHFDAIKVSHHGSKRNTNTELMKHISGDVFIFSACGTPYGHPHIESIARILFNSQVKSTRKLYFNYETETSKALNRSDWMEKYSYICCVDDGPIFIKRLSD